MSSTPNEDGRSGSRLLQFYQGASYNSSSIKTQYNLVVNPAATGKLGFHNPKRTLNAGLPIGPQGPNFAAFNVELQDPFGNPTPTASSVTVQLISYRVPSSTYDATGFSTSTAIVGVAPAPGGFQTSTTSVQVNMAPWGTTFYYLHTNATGNYTLPAASPAVSAFVNGVS